METWRAIPDWPYEVSDQGRVRRTAPGRRTCVARVLKPAPNPRTGYCYVNLSDSPRSRHCLVHRLVAEVFIGAPPPGAHQVNHKNGIKTDNHVANLEWVSPQGNIDHSMRNGLGLRGERVGTSKLANEVVREIRSTYTGAFGEKAAMARRYGVAGSTIGRILSGKLWAHVALGEIDQQGRTT